MPVKNLFAVAAAGVAIAMTVPAAADFTVTQQAAQAPTYSVSLNLDEAGTPTGSVSSTFWTASHGITIGQGVDINTIGVGDVSGDFPWIPSGNVLAGAFGVYLSFSQPINRLSFQAWDSSGPPGFFGGQYVSINTEPAGMGTSLGGGSFTGSWGGVGNSWFDITATNGDSFQYISITSGGFDPSWIDNLSWTVVPGPSGFALIGLAGLVGRGRRRG